MMGKKGYCETCKYWGEPCCDEASCSRLYEENDFMTIIDNMEVACINTKAKFGCVLHEPKELTEVA